MGLETGNYIADLVATNPVGATDFPAEGDDHLRLIKQVLQNSLPNSTAPAMLIPQTSTGTGNIYVLSLDPAPSTIETGLSVRFKADKSSAGDVSMDVGTGNIPVYIATRRASSGDIVADRYYDAVFDGENFQLVIHTETLSQPDTIIHTPMLDLGSPNAAQNIDWTQHDFQRIRMDKDIILTFTKPSGPTDQLTLLLDPDGITSGHTLTFPSSVSTVNSGYTINSELNKWDLVRLFFDGSRYYARIFEAMA